MISVSSNLTIPISIHYKNPTTPKMNKPITASTNRTRQLRYSTRESRMETFRDWPRAMPQTPISLADAGFIYMGVGDHVQCFYCNGGLKNWHKDDDPLVEHFKHFETCGFVQEVLRPGDSNASPELDETRLAHPQQKQSMARLEKGVQNMDIEDDDSESSKKLAEVSKENEHLKQRIACKVCMSQETQVVFEPCRHFVTCADCAPSVRGCPICRSHISLFIKTGYTAPQIEVH